MIVKFKFKSTVFGKNVSDNKNKYLKVYKKKVAKRHNTKFNSGTSFQQLRSCSFINKALISGVLAAKWITCKL